MDKGGGYEMYVQCEMKKEVAWMQSWPPEGFAKIGSMVSRKLEEEL